MKTKQVALIATFFSASLLLVSCKTTKPLSDSTPPTITQWTLQDQETKQIQKFAGKGGVANVTVGKEYLLTCYGQDPQGVNSLSVGANGTFTCETLVNGSTNTKTTFYNWYSNEYVTGQPDKDGKVETVLVYAKKFTVQAKYPCDFKFIPFNAEVKNYGGLKADGSIKLNIQ